MTTQVLRGRIEPLALVDVLAYLGRNRETGVLNVVKDETKKSIIINEGSIIFARSDQNEDRLGDILLAKGQITQEQYDQGTELIFKKGFRHGRALVEIGAISPKTLWKTIKNQIESIACSVIPWQSGSFEFIRQEIRQKESITTRTSILEMITDVIRNLDNRQLFKTRFPVLSQVYQKVPAAQIKEVELEPHEEYLLGFIDGKNALGAVCAQSEYGELESLRVVFLLSALGYIEAIPQSPQIPESSEIAPIILKFNQIFRYLNTYLVDRVGTVGTNLLKKYFEDTRQAYLQVLGQVSLMEDGSLNARQVQKNLNRINGDEHAVSMALDDALNEYLNIGIMAVKKVLGADHENNVIKQIETIE